MSDTRKLEWMACQATMGKRQRATKMQQIVDNVFLTSPYLSETNFKSIHPDDLRLLYELYDEQFFDGNIQRCLPNSMISFRLSKRMTSSGGQTSQSRPRHQPTLRRYEISIATTLLFQSFNDPEQKITVTGLECETRLEGLMRIMEHELVHLIEMLVWDDSSCSRKRFQNIAEAKFGHTEHTHQLITPRQNAAQQFGIRPGMNVRFDLDGHHYEGIVNRITKRATVLVPDPNGSRFTDGKTYSRFYVPVRLLEPID